MRRRDFIQLAAGTAVTFTVGSSLKAQRAVSKRPNVLLLFSDQHNANHLGCYGHQIVQTPNLDKLADKGVLFSRAYCQDGICLPSRSSMFTGMYPRKLGLLDNNDHSGFGNKEGFVPLQSLLRQNGYVTAAFGKRHIPKCLSNDWDVSNGHLKGEDEFTYWDWIEEKGLLGTFLRDWSAENKTGRPEDKYAPMSSRISELPDDATMEAFTAQKTVEFIRNAKESDKPFFCWSSFYRPHQPYTPTKRWADMYDPGSVFIPPNIKQPSETLPPGLRLFRSLQGDPWCLGVAQRQDDMALYRMFISYYYALVTEIDHHIGVILDELEKQGVADNTIVIYTTDHGDFVGSHGLIEKGALGHNIYEDTLRVPLIISCPELIKKKHKCSDIIQLIDLYPTIAQLCGIKLDDKRVDGLSLVPTLKEGRKPARKYAVSENWSQSTIITDDFKLGRWLECSKFDWWNKKRDYRAFGDMMFNITADPWETDNLYAKEQFSQQQEYLLKLHSRWESENEYA